MWNSNAANCCQYVCQVYVLRNGYHRRVTEASDLILVVQNMTQSFPSGLIWAADYALGYDLYGVNFNGVESDNYRGLVLPDAILIKKSYEEKHQRNRGKLRAWKLKSLDMEVEDKGKLNQEKMNSEYEQFLKDLPSIRLEELLADLQEDEEDMTVE